MKLERPVFLCRALLLILTFPHKGNAQHFCMLEMQHG